MAAPRRKIFGSLGSLVHANSGDAALTEALTVVDEALAVRILDLAIRIGETMLVSGAPASEVTLTIVRVGQVYGLDPVHVDVTYNSITAAHHQSGATRPITLMRVVKGAATDHDKLQRLQALFAEITAGLALDVASERYREIRRTPFRYRPTLVVVAQAFLAVGVAIMFGGTWLVMVLAFIAAGAAALTQLALAKARVPHFFSQIAGAFVLTMVAALAQILHYTNLVEAATIRPSIIVASGVVLMLAGLTVVGAAQDAIDGFALTATGRILELMTQTLGVVLGILIGLQTARIVGLGMDAPNDALPLGPIPLQFIGAAVIAVAVAIYNGARSRIVLVSAVLSLIAWLGYLASSSIGFDGATASGIGAFAGSLVGIVVAYRLHVPSVAITTAAILPLVPGAAVFRGLLTVVEANATPDLVLVGFGILVSAAVVGIALAVGASLGIYVGQPLRGTLNSLTRTRPRARP
ncbi:threonine/serine ThrE exporter family protein (plasmid) [Coraliomargarita sp. W4R53]